MGRLGPALAVLIALAGSLITAVPLAGGEGAASGCRADYTKTDWGGGFTAGITLTNLGDAWASWTLTYSYSGSQKLTRGWSGRWAQTGKDITVRNEDGNGSVGANGRVTIGGQFTYLGINTVPGAFAINGVTCTGTTSGPASTVMSTASSGAVPTSCAV
jgi:hypothetical protein